MLLPKRAAWPLLSASYNLISDLFDAVFLDTTCALISSVCRCLLPPFYLAPAPHRAYVRLFLLPLPGIILGLCGHCAPTSGEAGGGSRPVQHLLFLGVLLLSSLVLSWWWGGGVGRFYEPPTNTTVPPRRWAAFLRAGTPARAARARSCAALRARALLPGCMACTAHCAPCHCPRCACWPHDPPTHADSLGVRGVATAETVCAWQTGFADDAQMADTGADAPTTAIATRGDYLLPALPPPLMFSAFIPRSVAEHRACTRRSLLFNAQPFTADAAARLLAHAQLRRNLAVPLRRAFVRSSSGSASRVLPSLPDVRLSGSSFLDWLCWP